MSAAELFSLEGKRALVTGSGKVPAAVADLFESAGASVVRATEPDVSSEASAAALLAQIPQIDILVNGVVRIGAYQIDALTMEEWDAMHGANVRAAFLQMRAAVRAMRAHGRGGRIINLSTIGTLHPVLNGNHAYGSSRAGLNALTRSFALDFAKEGILTNAILVGAIASDPWPAAAGRPTGPGTNAERLPLGQGKPEDVAPLALLLASDGGRYINGQTIAVDGGFLVA